MFENLFHRPKHYDTKVAWEITLEPDDRLIITTDQILTGEQCERIKKDCEEFLVGASTTRVLVLDQGLKPTVIHGMGNIR